MYFQYNEHNQKNSTKTIKLVLSITALEEINMTMMQLTKGLGKKVPTMQELKAGKFKGQQKKQ